VKGRINELSLTIDLVNDFLGSASCPKILGDIYLVTNGLAVDGIENISLFKTCQVARRIDFYFCGDKASWFLLPVHSVSRFFPGNLFINVQSSQDKEHE